MLQGYLALLVKMTVGVRVEAGEAGAEWGRVNPTRSGVPKIGQGWAQPADRDNGIRAFAGFITSCFPEP
jgi:hypothetical protein